MCAYVDTGHVSYEDVLVRLSNLDGLHILDVYSFNLINLEMITHIYNNHITSLYI